MIKKLIHPFLIPFVVSLAMFMEAVDGTILNTAIPVMSQALKVHPIDLKIALISYLLSLAIFIPISGWIADKFGVKKVFISALIIFTLSSVWCGFSHSLIELVIARALQGFGGSLTLPVGRLIILRVFPRHEMVTIMNRVIMIASIGLMLGPVLGGLITHYFSWRWIFWVNLPVGLIAIVFAFLVITDFPKESVPSLDKLGFILFGLSLATFTFGLSAFSETYVHDSVACLIILGSFLLFMMYVAHSKKRTHPVVKMELFHFRTFRISVIGNLISRLGFGGIPFLLPLLLQISLGYSPQLSGLLLAPTALGVLLIKFFTLPILRFMGYRRLLILNTVLAAFSLWSFISINSNTSLLWITLLTFMYGFLISLQYSGMNSLAYSEVEVSNLSSATSIMGTMQQLSLSFGVAVSAFFVRIFSSNSYGKIVLSVAVFHRVFFAMGFLTLCSTLIFIRLKRGDGDQMIKLKKTMPVQSKV